MRPGIHDTITALATPPGEGGISVIRISGGKSFEIIENIFFPDEDKSKKLSVSEEKSHTLHFGYIFDGDNLLDEVLISIFKAPHSYTGEDVIEVSSHGGSLVSRKIISLILGKGTRLAEPGEFTKRAFLNGRMDLSQAEAVADLIKSKTDSAHSASIKQLEGSLSELVKRVRQDIINATSLVELELDFAEEDVEFVKKQELKDKVAGIARELEKIIASYVTGKVIREGVNLVIAGNPNAGKSSLFNYLLKTNRAIVSDIPGTTRDYIEESFIIDGTLFNLIDTAGLRLSEDAIESEGIKRSHKKMEDADLILYLIDMSEDGAKIKKNIEYFDTHLDKEKSLMVFSKADLSENGAGKDHHGIKASIVNDDSIEELKKAMIDKVHTAGGISSSGEIILTNLRHKVCLESVVASLGGAVKTIDEGMSGEYISVDLRNALQYLGEITGETTNDEILNNIFSKFCIGK